MDGTGRAYYRARHCRPMNRELPIGHNWLGEPPGAAECRCRCEGHRLAAAAASTDTACMESAAAPPITRRPTTPLGARAVQTAVLVIDRWPSHARIARGVARPDRVTIQGGRVRIGTERDRGIWGWRTHQPVGEGMRSCPRERRPTCSASSHVSHFALRTSTTTVASAWHRPPPLGCGRSGSGSRAKFTAIRRTTISNAGR
jgi:hypothetical protein